MKLAIFGASGATGRQLLPQALAAGHHLTLLVRNPAAITLQHQRLELVIGDARDPQKVSATIAGQDAVLSVLGSPKSGPVTICTEAITNILAAMAHHNVRRLVALSAYGTLDSHNGGLYNRLVWLLKKDKMLDKEQMEQLIQRSQLDWTVVRPPALTNGAPTHNYKVGTGLPIKVTSRISRADVADFILRQATDTTNLHLATTIVA